MSEHPDAGRRAMPATSPVVHAPRHPPVTPRSTIDPIAEAAILQHLDRGDARAALHELDRAYGRRIHRYIRQMVGRDDVADDVFQTTLVQAYRDLGSFERRSTLRTWVYAIARHRCLDALKAERRRQRRLALVDQVPEVEADHAEHEQPVDEAALLSSLGDCIDKLAPHVRMAVLLRYQEGFSYDELARICRERPEALRARVSRALRALRACVEAREAP